MLVMTYTSDTTGCDRRSSGLPNATLDKRYDNHGTEE